ncbi:hypothetical protein CAPTEDRAFT_210715 [Capitella teleta]|uniref:Origin recognition complex subunit 6 n=1 Tax=Capitella teleta TaxID=283909 RepID=R7VI16_CAPTE|nr:hypothetical protein CAPTEDRAFT_210715 [Capitella teleta]|eukprot:ELU18244.1 hypothetical protein CAPTEDRAFT_210715 [Capitella teleta]
MVNAAVKHGCHYIANDGISRQALEYQRLSEVRGSCSTLSSLNLTSSAAAVLCLDLAALECSVPLERLQAVRLSGMQKPAYNNALCCLQRLLDLQSKVSIPDLAIQCGCPTARPLAIRILNRYKSEHCGSDAAELSASLFNTAALYMACRKMKLKADKSRMVGLTGVKRPTFDRLLAQMERHADAIIAEKSESSAVGSHGSKSFLESLENMPSDDKQMHSISHLDEEADLEKYSIWKKRILTEAYSALGKKKFT